jgi:hypothetical protein
MSITQLLENIDILRDEFTVPCQKLQQKVAQKMTTLVDIIDDDNDISIEEVLCRLIQSQRATATSHKGLTKRSQDYYCWDMDMDMDI